MQPNIVALDGHGWVKLPPRDVVLGKPNAPPGEGKEPPPTTSRQHHGLVTNAQPTCACGQAEHGLDAITSRDLALQRLLWCSLWMAAGMVAVPVLGLMVAATHRCPVHRLSPRHIKSCRHRRVASLLEGALRCCALFSFDARTHC